MILRRNLIPYWFKNVVNRVYAFTLYKSEKEEIYNIYHL